MTNNQDLILRQLGDGLVLRRSRAEDADRLSEFNARIHAGNPEEGKYLAAWTRDLLERPHPTFSPADFTIVEDPGTGKIVSSMNLISQTWSYAGVPFKVGRPELVGTDPDYRNRGLVRAQFAVVHAWSQERGEMVQGITGIPYYYRLFGYEMALNLGGGRVGYGMHVPKLEAEQPEPFHIRPAVAADLPFIAAVYEANRSRWPVSAVWDSALWQYELSGKSPQNVNRFELRLIETPTGQPVGFLAHPFFLWGKGLAVTAYELRAGISWYAVTPAVIRYLWRAASEYSAAAAGEPVAVFHLALGASHPAYEVYGESLPRTRPPYAWYLRVADLPGFLRHIAPALEQRLANSSCCAYSGEFTIGFYRSGLKLAFQDGKLAQVEAWQPRPNDFGKAAFPGLTFLQLLFGYRSLDELHYAFPDSNSDDALKPVLRVLFPSRDSNIWMVS